MANSYMQYRQAGAAVREMFLKAASQEWGVDQSMLTLSNGVISGDGREAPLADFVAAASAMDVPAEPPGFLASAPLLLQKNFHLLRSKKRGHRLGEIPRL